MLSIVIRTQTKAQHVFVWEVVSNDLFYLSFDTFQMDQKTENDTN